MVHWPTARHFAKIGPLTITNDMSVVKPRTHEPEKFPVTRLDCGGAGVLEVYCSIFGNRTSRGHRNIAS